MNHWHLAGTLVGWMRGLAFILTLPFEVLLASQRWQVWKADLWEGSLTYTGLSDVVVGLRSAGLFSSLVMLQPNGEAIRTSTSTSTSTNMPSEAAPRNTSRAALYTTDIFLWQLRHEIPRVPLALGRPTPPVL